MTELSDHQLLHAWRDGDRQAGTTLVNRYFERLYRFFVNKVRSTEEAEDLVQRTMLAALEGRERFRDGSSVRSWLFAIASNILRQWYTQQHRKRARQAELGSSSVADLGHGPSSVVAKRNEHRMLLEGLRRLPLESQLILEFVYWEQFTAKQIGDILDCPEGTARSRFRKAKQELQAILDGLMRAAPHRDSTLGDIDEWAREIREVGFS